MQATTQVLEQLFAASRRVTDATGLLEHAAAHLAALPSVSRVAILVQQTQAPHRVRARAAQGLSAEAVELLGTFAPRGFGAVETAWPAALLPPGLPPDVRFCAVPLAATPEQVTLLCDGLESAETVSLVATFLALVLERADATQLQQVLVNLVTNAAHAMPRGGRVDICLATRPGTPPWAELTVKDEGQGMTPEVLTRAFEPFFPTRPVGKGTGVVLALPLVDLVEAASREPPAAVRGTQQRVALVDDEPLVARATERLVAQFGYHVTALSSAAEVLGAFAARSDVFDLVLTDQTMPEMTGLELTHALRERGLGVPVLLVTGLPTEIDVASVAPPFTVLGKPYRSEELARALATLLAKARAR